MWRSGDVVAMRNVWYGRVRDASPGFVVEDTPQRLVVWIPVGSPFRGPEPRGVPTEWRLVDGSWEDSGLVVHHWGTHWLATHVRPVEGVAWWYVDVADSFRRTAFGLDHRDLLLDVVSEHELRVVDQDELAEAVELGVVSAAEARQVEREAERALSLVARGEPPFDGEWDDWQPPAAWGVPRLPAGSEDV